MKRKISLMCDVDHEAVVNASDAPSIYDIPKVLHSEGLDAYVVRRLNLPFRDVDWTEWDELLRVVHHPAEEVTVALVGKYVDLPDAYLSVAEALRAGGFAHEAKVNLRLGALRRVPDPGGRRAPPRRASTPSACPAASASAASRARSARWSTPARTASRRSACAWACSAWSSSTPGTSPASRTPTPPSSTPAATSRSSPRWPSRSSSSRAPGDLGGTMRLGLYPAELKEGSVVRGDLRRGQGRGAPPAPLRGQQPLPRPARGGRAGVLRDVPGQQPGGVRRAARATCTPTTSRPRRTRSCGRARPGRTRCSRAWSGPRSPASGSCASRSTRPPCGAARRTATPTTWSPWSAGPDRAWPMRRRWP